MADKDQISILKKGTTAWNEWRESSPAVQPDLSGIHLKGLDLSEANFSKTNIKGTQFTNCMLTSASFTRATTGILPEWQICLYFSLVVASFVIGIIQARLSVQILVIFIVRSLLLILNKEELTVSSPEYKERANKPRIRNIFHLLTDFITFLVSIPAISIALNGFLPTLPIFFINILTIVLFSRSSPDANAGSAVADVVVPGILVFLSFQRMLQYVSENNRYPEINEIFNNSSVKVNREQAAAAYPRIKEISSITIYPEIDFISTFLGCIQGTRFSGSNLRNADFSEATLKFADFSNTTIDKCNFRGVKDFSLLKMDNNIFSSNKLVSLVVDRFNPGAFFNEIRTELISQKSLRLNDFSFLDLQGLCLTSATLEGIDLSNSNLSYTNLAGSNLSKAIFTNTNLTKANLKGANLSGAIFFKADLSQADLRGANISGARFTLTCFSEANLSHLDFSKSVLLNSIFTSANLNSAIFEGMDLSYMRFEDAVLVRANFSKARALGTNFQFADLTAACIEDWSINHLTVMDNIVCDYVFLKGEDKERKPGSGKFQPGEFAILVRQTVETIDLIFSGSVNWSSLIESFQSIQEQYGDKDFSVQSVEKKGDLGFVIKLSVPEGFEEIDRAEMESKIKAVYQDRLNLAEQRFEEAVRELENKESTLQTKEKEITLQRRQREKDAKSFEKMMQMLARPVNLNVNAIAESKSMQGNDNSKRISAGNDLTISSSTISFENISGQVTNHINQLPAESQNEHKISLKELLTQLQKAIESEPNLSNDEKEEALGEICKLAKAGTKPQEGSMKRMSKRASESLKSIASVLVDTSKMAKACESLLPMISSFF